MWQHWLPRFFLEGFTDPEVPEGHSPERFTPFVWTYDLAQSTWSRKAPQNIAAEHDYYTVTDSTGTRNDELERYLSQRESDAAPILRDKVFMREALAQEDIAPLAMFLALLAVRVPARQDATARSIEEAARAIMATYHTAFLRDPSLLADVRREYEEHSGEVQTNDLSVDDFDPSRFTIRASRAFRLESTFANVATLAKLLILKRWRFLHAVPPSYFIVSDRPVSICNPTQPTGMRGAGLAEPASLVVVPLSRSVALVASPVGTAFAARDAEGTEVDTINRLTARFAYKFLYAPKQGSPWATRETRAVE